MKPKSAAALMLSLAMLLSCACAPTDKPQTTPLPTAELTASPTAAPTEEPTAEPTDTPTDAPTAVPRANPAGTLGNLSGEALFDEPVKYLVLNGESDLHYVYDRFGTLVTTFNAADEYVDSIFGGPGFYGEYGAPCGYSIERGESYPQSAIFDDMMIDCGLRGYYDGDEPTNGYFVIGIINAQTGVPISFKDAKEYIFGWGGRKTAYVVTDGGVLHVENTYLIIDREPEYYDYYYTEPKTVSAILIDENGNETGRLDTSRFGDICGSFGGRYLLCTASANKYDLRSLSGELVLKNVELFFAQNGPGNLKCASYLRDENGEYRDGELNIISALPNEDPNPDHFLKYMPIELEDRFAVAGNVYAGIKDGDGNWLFKIYNPELASDSVVIDEWADDWDGAW